MGLLDGGLKNIVGAAFTPIFLSASIHVPVRSDGAGGTPEIAYSGDDGQPAATACKAITTVVSEQMRGEADYTESDVQIIILQKGLDAIALDTAHQITIRGVRYQLKAPIDVDPAEATWTARGTPV